MHVGTGHLSIAIVFLELTETPFLEVTCQRYYTEDTLNLHFDFLILNDAFEAI